MTKKYIGSHGDRTFFQLSKLPKGAKLIGSFKTYVDQEGETTGHAHRLKSDQEFKVYELGDRVMYVFNDKAIITHEEHKRIDFKPGIYEVDQELEESPQDGLARRVID